VVAHARRTAARAEQAAGRQAARRLLALLLPRRSAAELDARQRWCAHLPRSRVRRAAEAGSLPAAGSSCCVSCCQSAVSQLCLLCVSCRSQLCLAQSSCSIRHCQE